MCMSVYIHITNENMLYIHTDPLCPGVFIIARLTQIQAEIELQLQTGGIQNGILCGLVLL